MTVLLAITCAAHVRRRHTGAAAWRAAVWAFGAATLVYVAFAVSVVRAISLSHRSTAILGLVEIPFGGIPLSVATSLLVWSAAVVVLKWHDSRTRRSPSADGAGAAISSGVAAMALLILTVAAGLFVANAYTAHLRHRHEHAGIEMRPAAMRDPSQLIG